MVSPSIPQPWRTPPHPAPAAPRLRGLRHHPDPLYLGGGALLRDVQGPCFKLLPVRPGLTVRREPDPGRLLIAAGLLGFGALTLIYDDFGLDWQRVPDWVAER